MVINYIVPLSQSCFALKLFSLNIPKESIEAVFKDLFDFSD